MTRSMAIFLLVILTFGGAARAEPTEAERMARWSDLRHAIFGDRVVEDEPETSSQSMPQRAPRPLQLCRWRSASRGRSLPKSAAFI